MDEGASLLLHPHDLLDSTNTRREKIRAQFDCEEKMKNRLNFERFKNIVEKRKYRKLKV
jgi:hypothetical protein